MNGETFAFFRFVQLMYYGPLIMHDDGGGWKCGMCRNLWKHYNP